MVDNSIEQTRQALEQAKKSVESTSEKRVAFTPRSERLSKEKFQRDITAEQQKFETEVAKTRPEQANPEALERAYQEAKANVQKKYNEAFGQVKTLKQRIEEKKNWWSNKSSKYKTSRQTDSYYKTLDRLESQLEAQQAKTNVLKQNLSADKVSVVKNYFSGYTSKAAEYAKEKIQAQNEASKQRREAEQKAVEQYKQKWQSEGSKLDLKPVFSSKGDIVGFEDPVKQMSYSLENLGYQRPESLEQLKKAGLIDYEVPKPEIKKDFKSELFQTSLPSEFIPQGFSQKEKPGLVEQAVDLGILPNIEPIKERIEKVKDWYGTTGEVKAIMVDVVDESGNPTGKRVLMSGGELTKGELLSKTIKSSKLYKKATFYEDPYYQKPVAGALTGAALVAGTVAAPYIGIPALAVTGAKGLGLYGAGKLIKPSESKILYGSSGIEQAGLIGLYGVGRGLETAGELSLIGPAFGGIAPKAPTISKVVGTGAGGGYLYGRGKEFVQAESLAEVGMLTAGTLGEISAFKPIRAIKQKRIYKREIKNYNEALKEFESLKKSANLADTVIEKPYVSIGELRVGELSLPQQNKIIKDLGKINIPLNVKTNLIEVGVKQSYNQIITKVPKIKKIPVPETSSLYKVKKNIYQITVDEVIKYKNIVTYDFVLKNGKYVSYSITSFSNKPLPRFRNIKNALKYGSGKKIVVSVPLEGEFAYSQMYSTRGGQYKLTDEFISKPKVYKIDKKAIKGAETVKVGRAREAFPGLSVEELYEVSPVVGKAISAKKTVKGKEFYDIGGKAQKFSLFEYGVTKTTRAEDLSLLNKLLRERAKYFSKIKPARIKKLTIGERNFEISQLDSKINIIKNKINIAKVTSPSSGGTITTTLEAPVTLTSLKTEVIRSIPIQPKIRVVKVKKPTITKTRDYLLESIATATTTIQRQKADNKTRQRTKIEQLSDTLTDSLLDTRLATTTAQAKATKQDTRLATKKAYKTKTKVKLRPIMRPTTRPYVQPKVTPIPRPIFPLVDDYEKPKKIRKKIVKKKKPVKKKRGYKLQRTAFQAALGLRATKRTSLPDITGFEAFR